MLFNYRYGGETTVSSNAHSTSISFAPDTFRDPVFFVGKLNRKLPFREAISALHDVVISDQRFQPKDKTAYREWAARQEAIWLGEYMAGYDQSAASARMETLQQEIKAIQYEQQRVMGPFHRATSKYFQYLYRNDRDAWVVLDPVITVHPDELFFECFSQDESTYAKLGANYNVFKEVNEFKCGTTNIDYSGDLYNEFQKIRSYKETDFRIDPGGFEIKTTQEELFKEVKIDLPDSWVRGFLQVSSAMTLPTVSFDLHPMDVYNFCLLLRRFKEKSGPRSIRYILKPGEPVKAIFEPWNEEIICSRSVYTGAEWHEIRVWGRRRLLILERLIPVATKFTVHLVGTGLPSFYVADLGDMNFTLGLSGWTANDWSRAGNFDLLAPRNSIDPDSGKKVFSSLRKRWMGTTEDLVNDTGLTGPEVTGALAAYTQAGKIIYDLNKKIYRVRELSREDLPLEKLRFASVQEEMAAELLKDATIKNKIEPTEDGYKMQGSIRTKKRTFNAELTIDKDERIVGGNCDCSFYIQNKMYRGPCEHMLALRMHTTSLKPKEYKFAW